MVTQQAVLQNIINFLRAVGDANDAEDHGYATDAHHIREEAAAGIRSLLKSHPFLNGLFPNLQSDLDTQFFFDVGWAEYYRLADSRVQALSPDQNNNPDPSVCNLCSQLKDEEFASQKFGWPEYDTSLPTAVSSLVTLRDLQPFDSRTLQLMQCPHCKTFYLYKTDYEYLVNGTEDTQSLIRLTPEQAAQHLSG